MAKTSGSNKKPPASGGLQAGDSNYKGKIGKLESLASIKNPQVYKSVKESISRFHSVLGVRQKDIKIATLQAGVGGVHISQGGVSKQVVLNKQVFNGKNTTKKSVESWASTGYKSGHLTKTNKPVAHIITHELAHATWNQHLTSPNAKAATKSINSLYKKWKGDSKKSGYGSYAKTNVSEFWAEVCTKAVHGKADKYTRSAKGIIKQFKL
ncbi:hypothetical protein M2451_002529 [Dysgonomonas sp. PFB1-18]|uniref:hypothetical protein n=1 Tax=unclassified Dysgonomonas TaxID=2630389 RepID=UPI0024737815|nr:MULTISPECIES: hypothetical protein [unclassified Dysgonomonas]MDH6308010.1 hypothetical protein [Dysgonomonas sp. PF1-14]MDH6339549.1 hypothetical protein [Dysgonomonas sp. PF1-16]MDH6381200.1 hypothetical protein [Dysgonomonas sp. PFB1-18]MDH6398412.1 hypothetical protein [Dysgonomonas sp. PF1-23]